MKKIITIALLLACSLTFSGCSDEQDSDSKHKTKQETAIGSDDSETMSDTYYTLGSIKYKPFDGYTYSEDGTYQTHIKLVNDTANVISVFGSYFDETVSSNQTVADYNNQSYSNWTLSEQKKQQINKIEFTICAWSLESTPLSGSLSEQYDLNRSYSASVFNGNNFYNIDLLFKDDNCSYDDFINILKSVKLLDVSNNLEEPSTSDASTNRDDYDTGITYDNLARTPEEYKGQYVKFSGTVVQVIEDEELTQLRIAVDDNYDNIIYCGYEPSIVSSRILENDTITIYGTSAGLISYDSTMSGTISIPGVLVHMIDQ